LKFPLNLLSFRDEAKNKATIALLFISACATKVGDFKANEIEDDEQAIFGRIKVKKYDLDITQNCYVVFEGASTYQLDATGLVFHRINTESPGIVEFRCKDTSPYHFQLPKMASIPLSKAKNTANYFGDITVTWNFEGGFKISTLFGALGAAFDSGNDGALSFQVEDKFKETSPSFHRLHGKTARMKYVKALISSAEYK
jgi:hypothetical protein